jgi:hypothetical protein
MQIAHCYVLCIVCAHYILIQNSPSLSTLYFIAGKTFNIGSIALKVCLFSHIESEVNCIVYWLYEM